QGRGGAGQGAVQPGVGAELGVRPAYQCGNRPPGETAQAHRGPRPGLLRRAEGPGDRVRGRAAGLQRCSEAQSLRSDLGHPQDSLVRPAHSSLPHTVVGHAEGIPGGRRRCDDVPLDLDQRRDPRLPLGRGRLDPRGQRPDGQRRPAARLPPLQDVPSLRQALVKAFVTGGTGFVGAHLVQALRARGDEVTCLVRNAAKAHALGWSDVRLVRGDLDDAAAGPTTPGKPIDETRSPSPVTPYGQSKLAAELLVRAKARSWTIVRPPTVYGEWDREVLKVFKLARA